METIIGVLAVAAVAIVLLLSIPLDVGIKIETAATHKFSIRLGWLFGLLGADVPRGKPRPKRALRSRNKRHTPHITFRQIKRGLLTEGLFAAVARFLHRSLRAVTVRTLQLHVRFGFDDPGATGMVLAAAAPALSMLRTWKEAQFFAEPDFDKEIAEADGAVDVRIYPLRLITASVMFLLSPSTLRAAFQLL